VGLQTLENKALSWGIIGKSAPILAEITIRKSQYIIPTATLLEHVLLAQGFMGVSKVACPRGLQLQNRNSTGANLSNAIKCRCRVKRRRGSDNPIYVALGARIEAYEYALRGKPVLFPFLTHFAAVTEALQRLPDPLRPCLRAVTQPVGYLSRCCGLVMCEGSEYRSWNLSVTSGPAIQFCYCISKCSGIWPKPNT